MCIFCGGTCGGVGDSLITLAVASMPLIVTRVRHKWNNRKAVSEKISTEAESQEISRESIVKSEFALPE